MGLSDRLLGMLTLRRFWTDYLWWTERDLENPGDHETEDDVVDFRFPDAPTLRLRLDPYLSFISLDLLESGAEPVNIAWDDQAHWHPHVLRWDELEIIARATALREPSLPHPGPAVLLLHRFAPICEGDDIDAIAATLEPAWKALGLLTAAEITNAIERIDARGAGFRWTMEPGKGFVIGKRGEGALDELLRTRPEADGDLSPADALSLREELEHAHLYSLRRAEGDSFPFNAFAAMIEAATAELSGLRALPQDVAGAIADEGRFDRVEELAGVLQDAGFDTLAVSLREDPSRARACWIVEEILGRPRGTVGARWIPLAYRSRIKHCRYLDLPHGTSLRPIPAPLVRAIRMTLDGILRSENRGECAEFTTIPAHDSPVACSLLRLTIIGELEDGLRTVRDSLRWARAPRTVCLKRGLREVLPFDLDATSDSPGPTILQLAKLETFRWSLASMADRFKVEGAMPEQFLAQLSAFSGPSYRIDRKHFDAASLDVLRNSLSALHAQGPDEDGWHRVATDDGGDFQLCVPRQDEDSNLAPLTLRIETLSPEVARFTHELMLENDVFLMPCFLAASESAVAKLGVDSERIGVVETADDLLKILRDGPAAWWTAGMADS